jgi:uncharacterized protein with HEPN domain
MLSKDKDNLVNILEAVEKINSYASEFTTAEDLFNDSKSFDAILMNFIVIGEMVSKLTEQFITENPEIEWWKIKGLRNIVAHNYFGVDAEEIWQIIHTKIPELKQFIDNAN